MSRHRTSSGEAPLFAWGEALRARREAEAARRRSLGRRAICVGTLVASVIASMIVDPAPRLVWNDSESAPLGLYSVSPGEPIKAGMTVIARLPRPWRGFADMRRYLPRTVPLVKHVAAGPGQTVCAEANQISIDGQFAAERLAADPHGRPMPWWQGCRRLGEGQFFLLMTDSPQSFDGRYFGISEAADIIGPARLIWRSNHRAWPLFRPSSEAPEDRELSPERGDADSILGGWR